MSYTKVEIHYTTDGINTKTYGNTRDGIKKKTLAISKKVQEYGDKYGYSSIKFSYSDDHIILRGGGVVLQDQDINGSNNNEYIRSIVKTNWLL